MFKFLEKFFCSESEGMSEREMQVRRFPIEKIAGMSYTYAFQFGWSHANEFFEEHKKTGDFRYRDEYDFKGDERTLESVRCIFEVGYIESLLMTFGDEATMPCMGLVCAEIAKQAKKEIWNWDELHQRALKHIEGNFYRIHDWNEDKFRLIAEWMVSEELEYRGNAKPEIVDPIFNGLYGWRRKAVNDMRDILESWKSRYERQDWSVRDHINQPKE